MNKITTEKNSLCIGSNSKSFMDFVHAFVDVDSELSIDVKKSSRDTYLRSLKQFNSYLVANSIINPTKKDVESFRDFLLNVHNLKSTTVMNYIMAIKLFFKWSAARNIYPNIADGIKNPRLSHDFKKDSLSESNAVKLISSLESDSIIHKRNKAIITLMLCCGLRCVEISRAKISDIEKIDDICFLNVQGKGMNDKSQRVRLRQHSLECVQDYLNARAAVTPFKPSDPLFASTANRNKGKSLTSIMISAIVKKALRDINLDSSRLSAHSLRHSAASIALHNGSSLEEVSKMLRHKDLATTMIYTHMNDQDNPSESIIESIVFGADSKPSKKSTKAKTSKKISSAPVKPSSKKSTSKKIQTSKPVTAPKHSTKKKSSAVKPSSNKSAVSLMFDNKFDLKLTAARSDSFFNCY